MFKLILLIALTSMTTFSFAQDNEIAGIMTNVDFDLNDYQVEDELGYGPKDTGDSYFYELVSVKHNEDNLDGDYAVTVTLKRKWDVGIDNTLVDTKLLSRGDWKSRIYARDGHRIQVASARYRLNDSFSFGPAAIREKNYTGNLPRGNDNPDSHIYFGGSIRFVIK